MREAGISVCSGGILGLGEADHDRVGLIYEVARQVVRMTFYPRPFTCFNVGCLNTRSRSLSMRWYRYQELPWKRMRLVLFFARSITSGLIDGNQRVPHDTLVRTIATARIVLPETIIRLAAGRNTLSEAEQMMCFMAGANAVFTGEQMLTTPCEFPCVSLQIAVYLIGCHSRFTLGCGKLPCIAAVSSSEV